MSKIIIQSLEKQHEPPTHRAFHIPDISKLIEKRKLTLLKQLLVNPSTLHYITHTILISNRPEYSFAHSANLLAANNGITLPEILLGRRVSLDLVNADSYNDHNREVSRIRELINDWHIYENRV